MKDKSVAAAIGDTTYTQAKSEVLSLLPTNIKDDVLQLFVQFENATA